MPQKPSREAHRKTRGDPMLPWIGAIGLAIATGVAYFLAARLSLALLAKSGGLALFWLGGGVSSGVLIAFGRDARLPVAGAVMVLVAKGVVFISPVVWLNKKPRNTSFSPQT